jgi:uncharacterized protein (TIGR01370 family)
MIDLISGIASYARAHRKDFLIIPQNGDGLLGNSQFLETIDGFGREDLLYSETAAEVRNTQRSIVESVRRMRPLMAASKPILVIEYTSGLIHSDDSQIARSSSSSRYESRNCRERHAGGSLSA